MGKLRRGALALVVATCIGGAADPASAQGPPEPRDGWIQQALGLQHELASDVGWTNAPWVGTHNSFNSIDQTGVALSSNDSNQKIDLEAQLDAGIRSLELDVHRFPDVPNASGPIRVCHGRGADQAHFGCTIEKELAPTLAEIAGWLDQSEHTNEVLLLYLEDHMGDAAGYNAAAAIVNAQLGDRLYAPSGETCSEVPADLSRDDILATGAQALIVSDCGPGAGWAQVAFNWNSHVESRPVDYEGYPGCGPDYDRKTYDSRVVRYYEDSTALTNVVGPPTGVATPDDGIDPATAAAMAQCGVDLIGLDQVSGVDDPRLEALAWSWQVNRPRTGAHGERSRCVVQRGGVAVANRLGGGERSAWFDQRCRRLHRPACLGADGWTIPGKRLSRRRAKKACARRDLVLGTPRTGFEAQVLDEALAAADTRQAWLGQRRTRSGAWKQLDQR
ncbi:hypothetical protein BH24ACT23_BH24ACT23_11040 [soil metagenome]